MARADALLADLGIQREKDPWRDAKGGNGPVAATSGRLRDVLERLAKAAEKSE
jgi:hypothetical protein